MSATKTHSAAGVGFDSAALPAASPFGLPCRQSISGRPKPSGSSTPGLARCRRLVSSDAATATKERRPRWAWASKKRDQTRRGWRVACCRGRTCSRSMRAPALPEHSMEGLTFSGSRLQGGGHLAAGVRDPTAPAGCVAGWRWTCPPLRRRRYIRCKRRVYRISAD